MSSAHASGDRSVAAESISGNVATGDHARFIQMPSGGVPVPEQVRAGRQWNVVRRPSRVFVGREGDLDQLARVLDSGGAGVVGQSVAGLGGVGKTELAVHHAYRQRDRYEAVWWITADGPDNITAGLAKLAHRLAPTTVVLTDEQAAHWATAWLQHHRGWLLVLDNVNDPAHVEELIAGFDGGHILVTTRRDVDWSRHGLATIRLDVLDSADAIRMLIERSGHDDTAAAAAIAADLGFLPLALEQAAAYIGHHRLTLAEYHTQLREQPEKVYAGVAPGHDAERAITRVWDLTLAALRTEAPAAVEVLAVLAWLAPDDVPRDLLTTLTKGDRIATDQALGLLASYSMIALTSETVSVHRLVQAVLRTSQTNTDAPTLVSAHHRALTLLGDAAPANPQNDPSGWPRWRQLLPHITTLAEHHVTGEHSTTLSILLNQTTVFENVQGLHQNAATHAAQALNLAEAAYGPEHPTVAIRLGNLAASYSDLGRAAEAVPLFERALTITEAAYGPEHPDVAIWLGNLAGSFRSLGRAAEAVPLFERALTITETVYGPEHPTVATCLGNLAASYSDLGRAAEAVPLSHRAVAIAEQTLPKDHPTATSLRAFLEVLLGATD